jgi:hypothetical protein
MSLIIQCLCLSLLDFDFFLKEKNRFIERFTSPKHVFIKIYVHGFTGGGLFWMQKLV